MWFFIREVYGLKNLETMPKTLRPPERFLSIVERFLSKIPRGFAEEYFVETERGENDTARVQGQFLEAMLKNLEAQPRGFWALPRGLPLNESSIVLPEFNFNHILRVSKITSCDFMFILWPWIIWNIIKAVTEQYKITVASIMQATHDMINHV